MLDLLAVAFEHRSRIRDVVVHNRITDVLPSSILEQQGEGGIPVEDGENGSDVVLRNLVDEGVVLSQGGDVETESVREAAKAKQINRKDKRRPVQAR